MSNSVNLPKNVIIVTHSVFYGASDALRDFLNKNKVNSLIYISYPLLSLNSESRFQIFKQGKLVLKKKWKQKLSGSLFGYLINVIQTIFFSSNIKEQEVLYIGINPINALSGLLLRLLGKVDRVIFYAIDFTPRRFDFPVINWAYHALEKYAVKHSDMCWNVSPRISEGRQEFLGIETTKFNQQVVPIGVWEKDVVKSSRKKRINEIVFVGHLLEKQGVQLVIEAMPLIVKQIPSVHFTVIGGGDYELELKKLSDSLKLNRYISFLGWQNNQRKVQKILRESTIAVAPYSPHSDKQTNFTYYADPTKLKTYLAQGLPVVTTNVPYNAKFLAAEKVAFMIKYTVREAADTIISLLTNPAKVMAASKKARKYAISQTWEYIFTNAFREMYEKK